MRTTALKLGVFSILLTGTAMAQEAVRQSLTRTAIQGPSTHAPYNFKAGPVLFRVSAGLRSEFNDNVNYGTGQGSKQESDFIIQPEVGIEMNWTISQLNTIHLRTTLGYTKYLAHPELDSSNVLLSPDSVLSFNIYSGDFRFTLRDQFSYQEDPIGQGVGNVAKFGRFVNTVGLDILWDLNDVIATLSFDHTNFVTTEATRSDGSNQNISSLNHSIDQVSALTMMRIFPTVSLGLEAAYSYIEFPDDARQTYSRIQVGPVLEAQLSKYTKVSASAGYQHSFFPNTSNQAQEFSDLLASQPTTATVLDANGNEVQVAVEKPKFRDRKESGSSYYANLSVSNRLNHRMLETFSIGHDSQVGVYSQQTESTYANLDVSFQLSPQITLNSFLRYADTEDSGSFSPVAGSVGSQEYQLLSLGLSTSYQITKKMSGSLQYQFTRRTGANEQQNLDFTQNRIVLYLGYQF